MFERITTLVKRGRAFLRRQWNKFSDTITERLDLASNQLDESVGAQYPILTRFFRRLGLRPHILILETRTFVNFLIGKTLQLYEGLQNSGKGFLNVVASFIPFLPNRTSVWWAIGHEHLRKDFLRASLRDGFFYNKWHGIIQMARNGLPISIQKQRRKRHLFWLWILCIVGFKCIDYL